MINQILETLASESSTNKKLDILTSYKDNELLKKACFNALNPLINYYIVKIPEYSNVSNDYTLYEALEMLDVLSNRIVTGNDAIDYLKSILEGLSTEDAKVLEKVIKRDLRCGVSIQTVNKVWKNLIPTFPYMRISLPSQIKMDKINWKNGLYSQLKEDSLFANINYDIDGNIKIFSRNGSEFPVGSFENICDNIKAGFIKGFQYHGELLVEKSGTLLPREIGNGILNSVLQGGQFEDNVYPVYHCWDTIPLDIVAPKCKYNVPYSERYKSLKEQCETIKNAYVQLVETRIVYSMEEALEHYKEVLAKGLEGTILKFPEAIWKDGTSKEMIKLKLEVDVDLNMVGFIEGNGKNADTFGSIICESSDGLLSVNVSGFTDDMRKMIWDNRDDMMGKIITVKSNNIMKPSENNENHSLFLPRFVEIRNDKDYADGLESIFEQFESAMK